MNVPWSLHFCFAPEPLQLCERLCQAPVKSGPSIGGDGDVGGGCVEETVVTAVAALLPAVGSVTVPKTLVVRLSPPIAVGLPTNATVALIPLARVLSRQFTVAVPLHDPCEAEAETKARPAGSTVLNCTSVADSGPLLVTVAV